MVELFANSGDPDQTLHSAVSGLGLHCLKITLLGVSRLQKVNSFLRTQSKEELEESRVVSAASLPESDLSIIMRNIY